jgi:hypothetical protein
MEDISVLGGVGQYVMSSKKSDDGFVGGYKLRGFIYGRTPF